MQTRFALIIDNNTSDIKNNLRKKATSNGIFPKIMFKYTAQL